MSAVPELRFPEFEGDWTDVNLGELMEFRNGMNADKSRYGRGFKFVNVLDVIAEAPILDENIIGKVDADSDEVARFKLMTGDIVFQRSSETREDAGQANAYIGNGEALFGGFVIRGRPKVSLDAQYMAALLRTDNARKNITNLAGGSTRFNVGQETLSSVQIHIAPTLPEQKKIAALLSSVDEKLAALDAQLTSWSKFKSGMMKALFSKNLRFRADSGSNFPDWQETIVSSIGETFNGLSGKTKEDFGIGKPYISYKAIFDKSSIDTNELPLVDVSEDEKQSVVKYGDILFTTSSETPSEVGYASVFLDKKITPYLNSFAFGLRPYSLKVLYPEFAQYLFRAEAYRRNVYPLAQGSTRYNISKTSFVKMRINLPSVAEQQKIADALSAIDAKIEALTARLDATREFKRGLLQKMFV